MNEPKDNSTSLTLKQQLEQERQRAEQERRLAQWHDGIEEAIQEAQKRGDFDNLPGKGKPLAQLQGNSHAPEKELAFQLLKDNDYTLGWISRRNQTQNEIDAFRVDLQTKIDHYRAEWLASDHPDHRQPLLYYWRKQITTWETTLKTLNDRIRTANLQTPLDHLHLITLGLEMELKRYRGELDLAEMMKVND